MDSSIARAVTLFRWHVRVNSLWLWWYCICLLSSDAYLLYRAVIRCRYYNELPWSTISVPDQPGPTREIYAFISLLVFNVMCIPFVVVFSIFQIGNYANDGLRLGLEFSKAEKTEIEVNNSSGEELVVPSGGRSGPPVLWRHSGPVCHTLHLLSAFCLLLPPMLVQAQEIKYGFLPRGIYELITTDRP